MNVYKEVWFRRKCDSLIAVTVKLVLRDHIQAKQILWSLDGGGL